MAVVIPAAASAWERAREIVARPAMAYVERNFTAKWFNWVQVGQPGDEKIGVTHQLNGVEAQTRPGFTILADTPQMKGADLYIGWTGKDYVYTVEQLRKLEKAGANAAVPIARELGIGLDKVIWNGADALVDATPTNVANAITVHGITDAGTATGTYARPLILDGGSTSGDWEDAGCAAKDFAKLKSLLVAGGFSGPYGLFYPIGASDAFEYPLPTAAATFGEKTIGQLAASMFDVVAPLPKDLSGNHIGTKAADTSQAFQIYAVALGSMQVLYTQDFTIEALEWDKKTETGTIRGGVRAIPAFEVINIGGSLFKGVAEIAAIDLSD